MANAVVRAARERGLDHEEMHSRVEYVAAHGIATRIEGKRTVIGSRHFVFEDEAVTILPEDREAFDALEQGLPWPPCMGPDCPGGPGDSPACPTPGHARLAVLLVYYSKDIPESLHDSAAFRPVKPTEYSDRIVDRASNNPEQKMNMFSGFILGGSVSNSSTSVAAHSTNSPPSATKVPKLHRY